MRSDDELIDAFLEGDTKAFSGIVEKHRTRLLYVARKYVRNDHDAQDIVQEAFLKASLNLKNYRRDAQLYTWLHRLVQNAGYDFANHRSNQYNASLDSGIFDYDQNPALGYETDTDLKIILANALATLGPEQRYAFCMTEVAGYALAEVAKQQGVQTGTIKSRRARAKSALRKAIG
ncbi:RNA polymerase sigma factor [Corynebacterium phocae]|uniref:RNA polymerase sigma factor n=1 Tax=Corynebacterium phocae TaxID=161895 RepID=A0A1L7D6I1_9CORY|nr:sigma-70 family RNA polymerase sigma factor [Corynebacterium phocae]APT93552.1 RNA polymerase sigma factor [Corynebacterium phocae]KAA8720641.1 sigma-70 family RNA polymerase sigma factor [Corynebacterium phocae]